MTHNFPALSFFGHMLLSTQTWALGAMQLNVIYSKKIMAGKLCWPLQRREGKNNVCFPPGKSQHLF